MKTFKKVKWDYDNLACHSYNVVAKLEETLINLGVIEDFSDIEDTEGFVARNRKYSSLPNGDNYEQYAGHFKSSDDPGYGFKSIDGEDR